MLVLSRGEEKLTRTSAAPQTVLPRDLEVDCSWLPHAQSSFIEAALGLIMSGLKTARAQGCRSCRDQSCAEKSRVDIDRHIDTVHKRRQICHCIFLFVLLKKVDFQGALSILNSEERAIGQTSLGTSGVRCFSGIHLKLSA